jgi:hypothetical protein
MTKMNYSTGGIAGLRNLGRVAALRSAICIAKGAGYELGCVEKSPPLATRQVDLDAVALFFME